VTGQSLPPPTDITGKTLLRKFDPALADHYDAMERDPYGHIQSLREAEAKHKALAAAKYDESMHQVNPWRTGSRLSQDEVVRRGPAELVAFCQREAADVEVPLFGQNRNITILGKVASGDADSYKLIESAQRIHADWREQDKAAAQEQRAKAEATLRQLETVG
jgi:hypothetical protein